MQGINRVGEKKEDFLGSDIDLNNFPDISKVDREWVVVNQGGNGDYRSACTLMSTYSAILSLRNAKNLIKEKILSDAIFAGYEIGKGWDMQKGVKSACKSRNDVYPNKQTMYVRVNIGDKTRKELLKKGYCVIVGYKNGKNYGKDRRDNAVIDNTDFDIISGGHAISTYYSEKYSCTHLDTYPDYKNNKYEVKDIEALVKNGVYEKVGYAILPAHGVKNIKKSKYLKGVKVLLKLCSMYSEGEEKSKYKKALSILK